MPPSPLPLQMPLSISSLNRQMSVIFIKLRIKTLIMLLSIKTASFSCIECESTSTYLSNLMTWFQDGNKMFGENITVLGYLW